jgi:hypothetical protein
MFSPESFSDRSTSARNRPHSEDDSMRVSDSRSAYSRSSFMRWRASLVAAVTLLSLLALAATAPAATFTVNDTTDAALSTPAGTSCKSTNGGTCTLRAAVQAADNLGGANAIMLPPGAFTLSIPSVGEEDPSTGDLDVKAGGSLEIAGAGAGTSLIDANHLDRAFAVLKGASLSLSGVTIKHGQQPFSGASDKSTAPGRGGAIYNDGALSVTASQLIANTASDEGGAIFSDKDATSTSVTNSTLSRNASDDDGGALAVESGSVTLVKDNLTNNDAEFEGGSLWMFELAHTVGNLTVSESTISNNVADGNGGAMLLDRMGTASVTSSTFKGNNSDDTEGGAIADELSGRLTVLGSTFSENTAHNEEGGALAMQETDLTVLDSSFSGNDGLNGGAIFVDGTSEGAVQTISRSSFSANHGSDGEGGAVFDEFGDLTVEQSTFTQNSSSDEGGALYYFSRDGLSLVNDTFDLNQSREGGALELATSPTTGQVSLLNDTIVRNTAYVGGGVVFPDRADRIENTIVADNTGVVEGTFGADCGNSAGLGGSKSDHGHNIDSDMTCFGGLGVPGDQTGVDVLLAPLAENGGGLQTDALLSGSRAIGAANGTDCPSTDERDVPRPTTGCDVGAYQTGLAPSITIASPVNGATFTQGQKVTASYSCGAPARASVTECSGPVASGAAIDTSELGTHTFTVSAGDSEFTGASQSASYTVVAAAPVMVAAAPAVVAASPAVARPAAVTPVISRLSQTARTWRERGGLGQSAKKPPVGTTFSFSLNVPASVTFKFTTSVTGRRVGGKCVAQTRRNKDRPTCARTVTPGALTLSARAGTNKLSFQGLFSQHSKLAPGAYTAVVTATASGKASATRTLSFTITR